MKLRIKFSKTGNLMYISHLEVMRYFQKACKRAGLDMSYSQGFNPHQIMSFASPLGTGLTSSGEYMDIEVNSCENTARMIDRLNAVMSPDIRVLNVVRLPDNNKAAMAELSACGYRVTVSDELREKLSALRPIRETLTLLRKESQLIVKRKTKSREGELDIRPMIFSCLYRDEGFNMMLASGSARHLKPEPVLDVIFGFCGLDMKAEELLLKGEIHIHRTDMYAEQGTEFVPLDSLGEVME